jgi:Flp pilus assembly protein TadG
MRRYRLNPRRRQKGAVAVIVGIVMVVMIGMAGLALDLGQLYVAKAELQNAADACALSAIQSITGSNGQQLQIGEAAGMTTVQRHHVVFQSRLVTATTNATVDFATSPNGPWFHAADLAVTSPTVLTMRFARCTVAQDNINTWLIQALNLLPNVNIGMQTVTASAVAQLQPSQTTCALPVAICQANIGAKGSWLDGAVSANSALTGSFMWADLSPPQGGAAELAANLTGAGECQLPKENSPVGQTGNVSSLANEYNSRFGVYQGNVQPANAQPDRSGYAYTDNTAGGNWSKTAGNAYSNFISKRTSNSPYQGGNADVRGTIQNSTYLAAHGGDRRIMVAPVVDCAKYQTSQTAPVKKWACVLLLHPIVNNASGNSQLVSGGTPIATSAAATTGNGKGGGSSGNGNGNGNGGGGGTTSSRMYLEFLGYASDPGSPCASSGLPGGSGSAGPQVPTLVR